MGLKSAEFADNKLDWMHLYQMLVSKGLACKGFSNLVTQVAVLKHEVFVTNPGIISSHSHLSVISCVCSAALNAVDC